MDNFESLMKRVLPVNRSYSDRAEKRLASQIRPLRSLGLLEAWVKKLAAIQETDLPQVENKHVYIFAADHGITEEGVSQYPQEVTRHMVSSFLSGRATINVLASHADAKVTVIDMGVKASLEPAPGLLIKKIGAGTKSFLRSSAMTEEEMREALAVGMDMARNARKEGVQLAALGEMGIGNTTSASAIIAALTGKEPNTVTGHGTGIDYETWKHKVSVIESSLRFHSADLTSPLNILQRLGGFEIAGMVGFLAGAALERIPVVIDGLISSAAAWIALEMNPDLLDYFFFGHRSFERGQGALFQKYEVRPILDLEMRLGEASGACLAMNILGAAVRVYREVATFEEAGVAQASPKETMPSEQRSHP